MAKTRSNSSDDRIAPSAPSILAFVDGSVFYANGGGENTMRLNFTNSTDEAIRTGIEKLGKVIRREIEK